MKKIIKKYKNLPLVLKTTIWFVICGVLQKSISFITLPIFTRIMSAEQYGIYSIYLSWESIICVFCTLKMHNCIYMNSISKSNNDKEKNEVGISFLSLSSTITIILFIIYLLFHNFFNNFIGLPTIVVCFMFLQILSTEAINFWTIKQRFDYGYIKLLIMTITMSLLNVILGFVAVILFLNNQAMARIISYVLVYVIFGLFIYISYMKNSKKIFSVKNWKKALKVQLPLLPHELSLMALYSSDRIMINNIVGSVATGIYSVAYSAGYIINSIKLSIVYAITPWLHNKIKNKNYLEIKTKSLYILFFIFLVDIMFIAFAPELIKILAPSEYFEALYVIPPVATSAFFTFLYNMFSTISLYYEKSKSIMIVSVSSALLNILLNLIFINLYGYLAAAYTTLFSYIVFAFLHYLIMKKVSKDKLNNAILFDIPKIILLSLVLLVVSTLLTFLYKYIVIRYALIIGVMIYIYINRKKIISILKNILNKKTLK